MITEDLAAQLAVLERDYKPSRYPDSLVSGTPRGNYGPADAIRAQAVLAALRDAVLVAWEELVAEMEGRGNAGGEEDPRTV